MPATDKKPDGKYMYCIIRCPEAREFTNKGIGERGDTVTTINHRNLACVVSDSPVVDYDSSRRNMMAHTVVLEEAVKEFTILPVRFGTVAPTADAVRDQLLIARYNELDKLLLEMDGLHELGLKAFWFEEVIFNEIVNENPSIRKLRDSLVGKSAEETYFERIRLGEQIGKAMDARRERDSEAILARLRPLVSRTVLNKTITDRMIINAAFLIDSKREPDFDKAIQELDAQMSKRVMFKYVGPVPPYNFVNIVFHVNQRG